MSDHIFLIDAPKNGSVSVLGRYWEFTRHGKGLRFEAIPKEIVVDVTEGVVTDDEFFDASWVSPLAYLSAVLTFLEKTDMTLTNGELETAINAINAQCFSPRGLEAVRAVLLNGGGFGLFAGLLDESEKSGQCVEDAIESVDKKLEALAVEDETSACILMTYLWPIANRRCMRHISDGIDSWVANYDSVELRAHLKCMAKDDRFKDLSWHVEEWLREPVRLGSGRSLGLDPGSGKEN